MWLRFNLLEPGEEPLYDEDGSEVLDLSSARKLAVAAARDILSERIKYGDTVCLGASLQVADHSGNVVLTVPFADTVNIVPA